jgi:hypothetical protein
MLAITTLVLALLTAPASYPQDPATTEIMQKVAEYVAKYGEQASAIVGTEKYSQLVTLEGTPPLPPKRLVAEFAIVRAGNGWTGFRDVVEVGGNKVPDRKDRLERMLTEMTGSEADLIKIASENARYNVGPISRNINTPTAALFFFQAANLPRFTFTRKGTKKIDGVETVEIEFKETQKPTLIARRNGADVPMEGALWVVAADGTVVRTRLRMKNFADTMALPGQEAPRDRPAPNPNVATGGKPRDTGLDQLSSRDLETNADIEVTYKKDADIGIWLPSEMNEQYQGPVYGFGAPKDGRASTKASYSGFKKFGTGAAIKKG